MKASGLFRVATMVAMLAPVLWADVRPGFLFHDQAVLQQGRPVPVWGMADAGEIIKVVYAGPAGTREAGGRAGADGRWRVDLPALTASSAPGRLTITGKNTVVCEDVLVGEVWLASGQSNMEWPVRGADDAEREIAAANFPAIRNLKISRVASAQPLADATARWQVCSPATVKDFSAVAYFFAREIHREFPDVPVAIIDSTWGGTPIEPWMSAEALASDSAFAVAGRRWAGRMAAWPEAKKKYDDALAAWTAEEAAAKASGAKFAKAKPNPPAPPYPQHQPSALYNAMIRPLLPAAVRGVIWYQGETNVGRAEEYRKLFPSLIIDWRERFGQPSMPFYWVQLASYGNGGRPDGTDTPALREAQESSLALPVTGQALAIDVGHPTSIHPRNKQAVGRRLALIALKQTYGKKEVVDSGPVFAKAEFNAGAPGRVRVFFNHGDGGLVNRATGGLSGFEVAGADKRFVPAEAEIEDAKAGTVLVQAPAPVTAPAYVRYAWRNDPSNSLANGAGLPAAPFRTDR